MERNRLLVKHCLLLHCLLLFATFSESKPNLCTSPPDWKFYDVTTYLEDNSLLRNVSTINLEQLYQTKQLVNETSPYRRTPLQETLGNVTLVILVNAQHSPNNDQQTKNLELTYWSLRQANISDLRFIMINSKESVDFGWVKQMRSRLSFPVYQEMEINPLWNLLDGGNGDMFIYDRCGLLTYYIPFPLSFIHTKEPILREALVATYYDSPCKDSCKPATNVTINNNMPGSNDTIVATNNSMESAPAETATIDNSTETTTTTLDSDNPSDPAQTRYDRMGEIFMNFFGLSINTIGDYNNSSGGLNGSITVIDNTNITLRINQSMETATITTTTTTVIPTNLDPTKDSSDLFSTVSPPLSSTRQILSNKLRLASLGTTTTTASECNPAACAEWSTERLLKARLCCLKSPTSDEEEPSNSSAVSNNESTNPPEPDPSSSGFGCELYARWKCNRILPIIKCCLRKVMNDYFDFTIRRREQQQKEQLRNGESSYLGNNPPANQASISTVIESVNGASLIRSALPVAGSIDQFIRQSAVSGQSELDRFRQNHQKRANHDNGNGHRR